VKQFNNLKKFKGGFMAVTYDYTPVQSLIFGAGSMTIVYQFIFNVLGALIIFLLGLLLGKWAKKLVVKVLGSIKLSELSKKTAFEKFLEKAEVQSKIEEILGGIVRWLIILIFTVTAINMLGIPTISEVLNSVISYIPKIVAAIFVLGIGVILAGIIEKLVKGAVGQLDVKLGRLLGKVASYIMIIFASMAAINELGIAKELISILFIGFVSTLSLGFGLALGLGAKDLVSQILTDWHKQLKSEMNKKN
jgi:Mechanosensitive ion channel, conserved TM helix